MKVYDIEDILISPRVEAAWLSYLPIAVADLMKKHTDLQSHEIPDEQFGIGTFGGGEIFVVVRGKKLSMSVPRSEWKLK